MLVHEYVYKNEILTPEETKNQIDTLIKNGRADVVNEETIPKLGVFPFLLYQNTIEILRKAKVTSEHGSHWGKSYL